MARTIYLYLNQTEQSYLLSYSHILYHMKQEYYSKYEMPSNARLICIWIVCLNMISS